MSEVDEGKVCAILAWFFPIGLIWYFVDDKMKKNKFVEFHVKQSLALAIFAIGFVIVSMILTTILGALPGVGFLLVLLWGILALIVDIFIFVLFIIGLIRAIQGEKKELPLVGKYASKFSF